MRRDYDRPQVDRTVPYVARVTATSTPSTIGAVSGDDGGARAHALLQQVTGAGSLDRWDVV